MKKRPTFISIKKTIKTKQINIISTFEYSMFAIKLTSH